MPGTKVQGGVLTSFDQLKGRGRSRGGSFAAGWIFPLGFQRAQR